MRAAWIVAASLRSRRGSRAGNASARRCREARHGGVRQLLQRRGAAARSRAAWRCCTRSSSARRSTRSRRWLEADPVLRDRAVGNRPRAVEQSVFAGASAGRAAADRPGDGGARQPPPARRRRASASSSTRSPSLYDRFDSVDQPSAHARVSRCHGPAVGDISRGPGGRGLLRARARGGRGSGGQDLRRSVEGRRDPREAVDGAARSSRAPALHHPQLRRAGARVAGRRRGAPLREDRAGRAARAAHAVAHVHAPRLLAGFDRHQHPVGGRGAEGQRHRRRAARHRTTRPTPTCRPDRTRPPAASSIRCRNAIAPRTGHARRGARRAGGYALAAIPARYALERGAWADAARLDTRTIAVRLRRRADLVRARARRARGREDLPSAKAAVDELQKCIDRTIEAKENYWVEQVTIQKIGASAWVALAEGGRPRRWRDARGGGSRRSDREVGDLSGTARPGARTARRHAARVEAAEGSAGGVRENDGEGAEPVPRASPARPRRPPSRAIAQPRGRTNELLTIVAKADTPGRPSSRPPGRRSELRGVERTRRARARPLPCATRAARRRPARRCRQGRRPPSTTGTRRILLVSIRSVQSSTTASSRIVIAGEVMHDARVSVSGLRPSAIARTTMSRSVMIPASVAIVATTGTEPQSRPTIVFATSCNGVSWQQRGGRAS